MNENSPFSIAPLRKNILSFLLNKRCMSCYRCLNYNISSYPMNYKSTEWRESQCLLHKENIVCNWCYFYVWEYR